MCLSFGGMAYHAQMCCRMARLRAAIRVTLHADPTARPEAFGICLSLRLLPREPQLEFASQLTLGGGSCAAGGPPTGERSTGGST